MVSTVDREESLPVLMEPLLKGLQDEATEKIDERMKLGATNEHSTSWNKEKTVIR